MINQQQKKFIDELTLCQTKNTEKHKNALKLQKMYFVIEHSNGIVKHCTVNIELMSKITPTKQ